jgi:hypothetical protein
MMEPEKESIDNKICNHIVEHSLQNASLKLMKNNQGELSKI